MAWFSVFTYELSCPVFQRLKVIESFLSCLWAIRVNALNSFWLLWSPAGNRCIMHSAWTHCEGSTGQAHLNSSAGLFVIRYVEKIGVAYNCMINFFTFFFIHWINHEAPALHPFQNLQDFLFVHGAGCLWTRFEVIFLLLRIMFATIALSWPTISRKITNTFCKNAVFYSCTLLIHKHLKSIVKSLLKDWGTN